MRNTWIRAARVLVVVVAAAAVYVFALPSTHVNRHLLANLAIRNPHVAVLGTKPVSAAPVSTTTSSISVLKKDARRDPDETGIYETEWTGSGSSAQNDAGLLIEVLPNVADAVTTLRASVQQFEKPPAAQAGETVTFVSHFHVPSTAATGNIYAIAASSSSGAHTGFAYTAAFRVDRAVVVELLELARASASPVAAQRIAGAEAALLATDAASFSMVQTTRPLLGTVLVGVGALVAAAAAYFLPEWVVARRAAREARARDRARSEYRSRGRRAVKRHQAPAWRQQRRR